MKTLRPNVFIAQPRRDAKRPLPQLVHDAEYVGAPFACITKYGITDGLPVDQARNDLMHHALRMGAEYIWFVDDDTVVPYDALYKLHGAARLGYPIVGGVVTGNAWSPRSPSWPALPTTGCTCRTCRRGPTCRRARRWWR